MLKENSHRIAGTLSRYAEDPAIVRRMAALLNYDPAQLKEDIDSLYKYIKQLEAQEE